ncbi:unnamed protein product [Clonostachys rosea]|uniref:Uncharacterized protein n=1 Tax=Bionectria ochroleuca TaxID=29856 RepID=A0ABY6TY02_BIOOC|nr:unnamed protein product [Clonostachys rosea]
MPTFTFSPTAEVTPTILSASSIHAKPIDAYVDAAIKPSSPESPSGSWIATVGALPQANPDDLQQDRRAVLHLTKGELGTYLGSVDLGRV